MTPGERLLAATLAFEDSDGALQAAQQRREAALQEFLAARQAYRESLVEE